MGRTRNVNLVDEAAHPNGDTSVCEDDREGVEAVDDFREVLGVVKVECLETKDLSSMASVLPGTMVERNDTPRVVQH